MTMNRNYPPHERRTRTGMRVCGPCGRFDAFPGDGSRARCRLCAHHRCVRIGTNARCRGWYWRFSEEVDMLKNQKLRVGISIGCA